MKCVTLTVSPLQTFILVSHQGLPLDTADEMYTPYSYPSRGASLRYDVNDLHDKAEHVRDGSASSPTPTHPRPKREKRRPSPKDDIIPLEEDIQRLFHECSIGQGNARLLYDNLAHARLEDRDRDTILKVRLIP